MAVIGPLVSAERITSRKGVRYSSASTVDQSVEQETSQEYRGPGWSPTGCRHQ